MNSSRKTKFVGIMASELKEGGMPPFGERAYYARLCTLGRSFGLTVYVFSPLRLDEQSGRVRGYTYISGTQGWQEREFPLPELIYDRLFYGRREDCAVHRAAVRKLLAVRSIPFLGHGLKSKWETLLFLQRDPELAPYLPQTRKLKEPEQALRWLERAECVFLKPAAGSQGKGAIKAERLPDGYRVHARDGHNRPLIRTFSSPEEFAEWLHKFTGKRTYLLQQYLYLHSDDGGVWDVRALVQKNGKGLWELTGMAVRKGGAGSITSNLHGGGTALEVEPYLVRRFGPKQAQSIQEKLLFLARRIPPVLESSNGRMAELGLDLGVDREGRVWIIEVNTKPGRSIFRRVTLEEAGCRADHNPMAYASHILRRSRPLTTGAKTF